MPSHRMGNGHAPPTGNGHAGPMGNGHGGMGGGGHPPGFPPLAAAQLDVPPAHLPLPGSLPPPPHAYTHLQPPPSCCGTQRDGLPFLPPPGSYGAAPFLPPGPFERLPPSHRPPPSHRGPLAPGIHDGAWGAPPYAHANAPYALPPHPRPPMPAAPPPAAATSAEATPRLDGAGGDDDHSCAACSNAHAGGTPVPPLRLGAIRRPEGALPVRAAAAPSMAPLDELPRPPPVCVHGPGTHGPGAHAPAGMAWLGLCESGESSDETHASPPPFDAAAAAAGGLYAHASLPMAQHGFGAFGGVHGAALDLYTDDPCACWPSPGMSEGTAPEDDPGRHVGSRHMA